MKKRYKTKIIGISLISIGCLMVVTIFATVISWKLVIMIIGVMGGCYLVKLGVDRLTPLPKVIK